MMKLNVGPADRVVRMVLGSAVVAGGLYFQSWFGLVGLVILGTALIGWCPAYPPFGISTCGLRSEGK
jgi:hypothetical protein